MKLSLRKASVILKENGIIRSHESVAKMVKHGAIMDDKDTFLSWVKANPQMVEPRNGRPPNHECAYGRDNCKGRRVRVGKDIWVCQEHNRKEDRGGLE